MAHQLHLDRVALDGVAVGRRSATLRRDGQRREWRLVLACERLTPRFEVGPRSVRLDATTPGGRTIRADAVIVDRRDDDYGTQLVLIGAGPLADARADDPIPPPRSSAV